MDNPRYSNKENQWVEDRIASLSPPPGWRPDADRVFERVMQQGRSASSSRGLRIAMAAATLGVIALVLTLLPWSVLWTPKSGKSASSAAAQEARPPETATGPSAPPAAVTEPAQPQESREIPAVPVPKAQGEAKQDVGKASSTRQERAEQLFSRGLISRETFEESQQTATPVQAQSPPSSTVSEPVLLSQVQPAYTPEAREARIQGTVELRGTVREDGTIKVDSVAKGLGYGLDEAAVAAVEQWKFAPGKKDGKPVPVVISLLVNFTLR